MNLGWASENLSEQENAFNYTVDYGTVEQINMALGASDDRGQRHPTQQNKIQIYLKV